LFFGAKIIVHTLGGLQPVTPHTLAPRFPALNPLSLMQSNPLPLMQSDLQWLLEGADGSQLRFVEEEQMGCVAEDHGGK
jgi:hypothetical protein